jgi:hypothetical protein
MIYQSMGKTIFADKTIVAQKVETDQDAAELLKTSDNLSEWSAKWKIEFKTKKCKVMHVWIRQQKLVEVMLI